MVFEKWFFWRPLDLLPSYAPRLEEEGSIRHQTVSADPLLTLPLHGEVRSNKEEDGTPKRCLPPPQQSALTGGSVATLVSDPWGWSLKL